MKKRDTKQAAEGVTPLVAIKPVAGSLLDMELNILEAWSHTDYSDGEPRLKEDVCGTLL